MKRGRRERKREMKRATAEEQRSSKPAHRGREEEEEEEGEREEAEQEEHERGFRRDTNTQEILSSLLMFCFFALCFVCPLPVLLMWTPRPVANVHKGTCKSHPHAQFVSNMYGIYT